MKKRLFIMVTFLLILFGGIAAWDTFKMIMMGKFFASFGNAPVTVSASEANTMSWQPYLTSVGNFSAHHGVDINSEASGIITKIHFKSGQMVEENAPLVQLDDTIDQAVLTDNKSKLALAALDFKRQSDLFKKAATSTSALDAARAHLQQAQAAVEKIQAQVNQKNIKAPFAGKLGIRRVNLGEYVNPGSTKIVTLQDLSKMHLEFYLPEQDLPKLFPGQAIELTVDAYPDQVFPGEINAINAKVNEQTHTILVQAKVPNPDNKLYPGMFANVNVLLPLEKDVVVLPNTAISYSLYGDSVFVIRSEEKDKEDKPIQKAYRQFVVTGDKKNNQVVIKKGVKSGDLIVNAGQLKLHNGTLVKINNSVKLEN